MRVPGPGMPPHRYVMISEGDRFFINNDPGGNLTAAGAGWTYPQQHPHPGGSGGVSMQWAPDGDPTKPGWYYSVTGGASVGFARSRDLQTWEGGYHVAMSQQADLQHRGVCVRARARVCVCVCVCVAMSHLPLISSHTTENSSCCRRIPDCTLQRLSRVRRAQRVQCDGRPCELGQVVRAALAQRDRQACIY